MKRWMILPIMALVAAGCGGGGGAQPETLADVQDALREGGVACGGTPGPYDAEAHMISMDFDPVEELECTIDGVAVSATRWDSESERAKGVAMSRSLMCGFGAQDDWSWVVAGTWMISAEGVTPEADAVTARIADVLEVEPTTYSCGDDT